MHADPQALEDALLELGGRCLPTDSKLLILDFDATDEPLHGRQDGRFFRGYYSNYCYLPLYCFCDSVPLRAQLRLSDKDASRVTVEALKKIVAAIRQRMPKVKIVARGATGCVLPFGHGAQPPLGTTRLLGGAEGDGFVSPDGRGRPLMDGGHPDAVMVFIAGLSFAGADARDRVGGVATGRGDPRERALAVAQSGGVGASERSPGACGTLLGCPLPGSLSTGGLALANQRSARNLLNRIGTAIKRLLKTGFHDPGGNTTI